MNLRMTKFSIWTKSQSMFRTISYLFVFVNLSILAVNYMFIVKNRNTRTRCEIWSELTETKTETKYFWCRFPNFFFFSSLLKSVSFTFALTDTNEYIKRRYQIKCKFRSLEKEGNTGLLDRLKAHSQVWDNVWQLKAL